MVQHDGIRPQVSLSVLSKALARTDFADGWYRWCDADRDWSVEAQSVGEHDSLLAESGAFTPLHVNEFMDAYRAAGATVSRGSTFPGPRHRSFTVQVAAGEVVGSLAVRLGRGLNSEECSLVVEVSGVQQVEPELLHVVARNIRLARGERDPWPANPYPRPIIGSRSQLEVTARELVDVLKHVARHWLSE